MANISDNNNYDKSKEELSELNNIFNITANGIRVINQAFEIQVKMRPKQK